MVPYPQTTIPTLPTTGNFCLWQVHKEIKDGSLTPRLGPPYQCGAKKPYAVQRGNLKVTFEFYTAGTPCDQAPDLIPNGSRLIASGVVFRRADGLVDFASYGRGRFAIMDPNGLLLFTGFVELMIRIGTHQPPFGQEHCEQENHMEGWLVGLGATKWEGMCLRALLVANAVLDRNEPTSIKQGYLNGVVVMPTRE
jgi:hypothetical protein